MAIEQAGCGSGGGRWRCAGPAGRQDDRQGRCPARSSAAGCSGSVRAPGSGRCRPRAGCGLEDAVPGRGVEGRHARGEAEFADERAVHAPEPRVGQRLVRALDGLPGEAGHLEDGGRGVGGDVDDPPVHHPGQREAHGGRDVAVVGHRVRLRGVQAEPLGERADGAEVAVALPVDEREPQDRPGQAAVAEQLLGRHLARPVRGLRRDLVGLQRRAGGVRVVDVAGAAHDQPGPRRVLLHRGDQVAGAVEVGAPDGGLVVGAEQRRQVDHRVDALHRRPQRAGVVQVTADAGGPRRQLDVAADECAAGGAVLRQARQQPRTHETGGAGEQQSGHVVLSSFDRMHGYELRSAGGAHRLHGTGDASAARAREGSGAAGSRTGRVLGSTSATTTAPTARAPALTANATAEPWVAARAASAGPLPPPPA